MSKGHIDYNIRKVYNMLLLLKMEPKEAIDVLAHALNLHTEQGKADLKYMLKFEHSYGLMEETSKGTQRRLANMDKETQRFQAIYTAIHEGLSVRQVMKSVGIPQRRYYAELPNLEFGSREDQYLQSRNDLDLSRIERVLKLAKTHPIL